MVGNENEKPKPSKIPRKESKDQDGFVLPPARHTRKFTRSISQKNVNFETKNKFDDLSESEMSLEDESSVLNSSMSSSPLRRKQAGPVKQLQTSSKSTKPIVVLNASYKALRNNIAALNLSKAPKFQKRHGNDYNVVASNAEDKKLILEKLKEIKHEHFTFTENDQRHKLFVLLGHHELPIEELLMTLTTAKVPATKVTKINRSCEDPIFLVSFAKESITLADLQHQFNTIDGLRVTWDKFKPKTRRPVQCRNCQRFGHAANNCNLKYRCVKCLDDHEPGKCARVSREEGLPSCVNCQIEGHASNSPNCPINKKNSEFINRKKKSLQRRPREFPATRYDWSQKNQTQAIFEENLTINSRNFPLIASQSPQSTSQPPIVNQNREYRPPLSQPKNRSLPTQTNLFSQIRELQSELAAIPDIQESITLFAQLVKELKNANSHEERIAIFMSSTGLMPQLFSNQK